MTPYFLRFPDSATGLAALAAADLLDPETAFPITASLTHALDVIGPIVRGGSWNPETGEVLEAPTLLEGWHANYQGELPDGWSQYVVTPQNPARVWAGSASPEVSPAAPIRARRADSTFISDDPATPDVDETWVTP
jgi:hypothetical protein